MEQVTEDTRQVANAASEFMEQASSMSDAFQRKATTEVLKLTSGSQRDEFWLSPSSYANYVQIYVKEERLEPQQQLLHTMYGASATVAASVKLASRDALKASRKGLRASKKLGEASKKVSRKLWREAPDLAKVSSRLWQEAPDAVATISN